MGKIKISEICSIFIGNVYLLQLVARKNWVVFGFYNEIERKEKTTTKDGFENKILDRVSGCLGTMAVSQTPCMI